MKCVKGTSILAFLMEKRRYRKAFILFSSSRWGRYASSALIYLVFSYCAVRAYNLANYFRFFISNLFLSSVHVMAIFTVLLNELIFAFSHFEIASAAMLFFIFTGLPVGSRAALLFRALSFIDVLLGLAHQQMFITVWITEASTVRYQFL